MTIYAEKIRKVFDLDADRANFSIIGMKGTALVNQTTDIDFKLTEERWISGGILLAQGTNWGDRLSIQFVDKDNVLGGGAGAVVGEYVTNFYMITDSEFQTKIESPYIALIPANLYLRIKYTNTSLLDPVEVALNLITHIPKA